MKNCMTIIMSLVLVCNSLAAQSASSVLIPTNASRAGMALADCSLSAESFGFEHLSTSATYGMWAPEASNCNNISLSAAMNFGKLFSARIRAAHISDRMSGTLYNEYGAPVGEYKGADLMFEAGFGVRIMPYLAADISVKMLNSNISPELKSNSVLADINVIYKRAVWSASIGARNLGTLPSFLTAGATYYRQWFKAEAEFDYFFSGAVSASLGGEFNIKDLAFARAGYRYAGKAAPLPSFASAGFGVKLFGVSLDACYLFACETLGGTMMFSLGYAF